MGKSVLVTGFEPFLDLPINPTQTIVEQLDGTVAGDIRFYGRILPVDYDKIEKPLISYINRVKPDLIIGTGLAAGRAKISIEKIAINYKYSQEPDNAGKRMRGERIDKDSVEGSFSLLEVERLVEELNNHGIPAEISLSAGAYLCNYAMFIIVREAKKRGIAGGFIHFPADTLLSSKMTAKSFPSLDIQIMKKSIRLVAEYELGDGERKIFSPQKTNKTGAKRVH
ncbi:MAG: pyrrolidone-carboxylate peptidase [Candidatus Thermoplasmatota archaeon]|nr:pyrrolidone-carboxylate peptidase [Candidatus Thermoplasmatota archaeon]